VPINREHLEPDCQECVGESTRPGDHQGVSVTWGGDTGPPVGRPGPSGNVLWETPRGPQSVPRGGAPVVPHSLGPPSGLDDNVSEFSKTVSGSLVEVSAHLRAHS
jgi:hypothetical protein